MEETSLSGLSSTSQTRTAHMRYLVMLLFIYWEFSRQDQKYSARLEAHSQEDWHQQSCAGSPVWQSLAAGAALAIHRLRIDVNPQPKMTQTKFPKYSSKACVQIYMFFCAHVPKIYLVKVV